LRRFASTVYLDTSVLLPMLDKKGEIVPKDQASALSKFRYRLTRNNQKVKISIAVLGEVLVKAIERKRLELIDEMAEFTKKMEDRLEVYSPKFRSAYQEFYKVLENLLIADDYLRDHPTDALILTMAALDEETSVFYTMDNKILLSKRIKDAVERIRSEYNYRPLKINSPPIK